MENKDLRITEIIQNCKRLLDDDNNFVNEDQKHINDYNIWKAYSWIEYCILIVRIHKYNLSDPPPSLLEEQKQQSSSKIKKLKKTKIKIDEKLMRQNVMDLISNLNYEDEEKMLDSLRAIRDLLKAIVKERRKQNKKNEQDK